MLATSCYRGCNEKDEDVASIQFLYESMLPKNLADQLKNMASYKGKQLLADDEAVYAIIDCHVEGLEEWPDAGQELPANNNFPNSRGLSMVTEGASTRGSKLSRNCTDIVAYGQPPPPLVDFTDELNIIDMDLTTIKDKDLLLQATATIQDWDNLEYELGVDDSMQIVEIDPDMYDYDNANDMHIVASMSNHDLSAFSCRNGDKGALVGCLLSPDVSPALIGSEVEQGSSEESTEGSSEDSGDEYPGQAKHGKGATNTHKAKNGYKICEEYDLDPDRLAGTNKSSSVKWDSLKCGSYNKKGNSKATKTWRDLLNKSGDGSDKDRQKVIQALYKFEELRQNFIEVEGARAAKGRANGERCNARPDLRASSKMKVDGLQVNTTQCIGNVPGIQVGDRFWYRVEMLVVGLHKQLEGGIAYIGKHDTQVGVSLATSIVMKHSGNPYQDDSENGEVITYTGQGGLSNHGINGHSIADQALTRGNEALKNSCQHCKPVRVIRGSKDSASPTGESYMYIGLYQVMSMRYETGVEGKFVYKFDLRRLPGQPELQLVSSHRVDSRKCSGVKGKGCVGKKNEKRPWESSSLKCKGGKKVSDTQPKGKKMKRSLKRGPFTDEESSDPESSPSEPTKTLARSFKGKSTQANCSGTDGLRLLKGKSSPLLLGHGQGGLQPLKLTWESQSGSAKNGKKPLALTWPSESEDDEDD